MTNLTYPKEIFKAYDIRGVVATQLTEDVVHNVGKVLGTMALEAKASGLVVGWDGRLSSPMLAKSLIAGILKSGCTVFEVGMVTTPMVYFANFELKTYSGVMITGSHNPPEYNGLKMVVGGETLFGEKIQTILKRLENNDYFDNKEGSYSTHNIMDTYVEKITSDVKLNRQMNIIIDCGNGVAGKVAPLLYRRMGAKVLGLFCDVDGNFPNHHPDPSKPENLADLINGLKNTDAEVGLAFDGDGDRLGVVAKDGNIIYPDRQMMLFAADVLEKNPGAKIIYDVKSTRLLGPWIKENHGEPIMCRTGHSFIKAKIKETGAKLAGEMSGHIFFNDRWNGADDGVYAGARMLEVLSKIENPGELLNALPNAISTPEINIDVLSGKEHEIVEIIQKTEKFPTAKDIIVIDGVRVEYADGFGLIRASNTTPVLVLRFEADCIEGLERIKSEFRHVLAKYIDNINF